MVTSYKAFLRNDYIFGLSLKKIRRDGWIVSPGWVGTTVSSLTAASDLTTYSWAVAGCPSREKLNAPVLCFLGMSLLPARDPETLVRKSSVLNVYIFFSSHQENPQSVVSKVPKSSSRRSLASFLFVSVSSCKLELTSALLPSSPKFFNPHVSACSHGEICLHGETCNSTFAFVNVRTEGVMGVLTANTLVLLSHKKLQSLQGWTGDADGEQIKAQPRRSS